jgi:hypothetical protein
MGASTKIANIVKCAFRRLFHIKLDDGIWWARTVITVLVVSLAGRAFSAASGLFASDA